MGECSQEEVCDEVASRPEVCGEVASRRRVSSGRKSCQCKLTVDIGGERVRTCAGLELQRAQRSVSLRGFPRASIENMFYTALGFNRADEKDRAEAEMMAEKLAAGEPNASRNYLVCVAHFPPLQLHFTARQVKFKRATALGKAHTAVWPSVPAAVVRARAQAMREGMPPADALTVQPPAAPARLSPGGRVNRGGKRRVAELVGVRALDDGSSTHAAVPKLARPSGATSIGTGERARMARSLTEQLDGGRAADDALHDEFDGAAERSGDLAAELASTTTTGTPSATICFARRARPSTEHVHAGSPESAGE